MLDEVREPLLIVLFVDRAGFDGKLQADALFRPRVAPEIVREPVRQRPGRDRRVERQLFRRSKRRGRRLRPRRRGLRLSRRRPGLGGQRRSRAQRHSEGERSVEASRAGAHAFNVAQERMARVAGRGASGRKEGAAYKPPRDFGFSRPAPADRASAAPRTAACTAAAINRAQRAERFTRALSVAIPVFAYICRYSFEISTNASRDFSDSTQRDRSQIFGRL